MPKKIHACPGINKSTERRPRLPKYQFAVLSPIAGHCSLHYYLSPQAGLGMRRKLSRTFFRSEYILWNVASAVLASVVTVVLVVELMTLLVT